jgi:hypothetical protein
LLIKTIYKKARLSATCSHDRGSGEQSSGPRLFSSIIELVSQSITAKAKAQQIGRFPAKEGEGFIVFPTAC